MALRLPVDMPLSLHVSHICLPPMQTLAHCLPLQFGNPGYATGAYLRSSLLQETTEMEANILVPGQRPNSHKLNMTCCQRNLNPIYGTDLPVFPVTLSLQIKESFSYLNFCSTFMLMIQYRYFIQYLFALPAILSESLKIIGNNLTKFSIYNLLIL